MKERPILFSGEMVQAILDGRKTQTRRVIKPQPGIAPGIGPVWKGSDYCKEWIRECPYGIHGDRLWVRETWASFKGGVYYRAEGSNNARIEETVGWRPSIFMPKIISRIWLEITDIRVERVQEISPQDVCREGIRPTIPGGFEIDECDWIGAQQFKPLWDSINAKRGYGWDMNPWVWVISFRRIGE